jgi:putative transposase
MGYRKTILATGEIYHVYNRGVEKRLLFLTKWDYMRFLDITNYYRFANCPIKYSYFKLQSGEDRTETLKKLEEAAEKWVDILTFCLMPNHVHFLLKQLKDNGISKFMAKITNSYSHFFNTKQERVGHLFQGNFKAKRIESDEQLIHVSRYIHLNPVTSYITKFDELEHYEYSSYSEFMGNKEGFCDTKLLLSYFKNKEDYRRFVKDQADYNKRLEEIEHLILE